MAKSKKDLQAIKNGKLYNAAVEGRLDVAKEAIGEGAEIRSTHGKTSTGLEASRTPLHAAAEFGHLDIVKLLMGVSNPSHSGRFSRERIKQNCRGVLSGKYCDLRDAGQRTALHWASRKNHSDVIQYLIEAGALIDPVDCKKKTPLHIATREGAVDALKTLIEKKANLHARDGNGMTASHFAAIGGHVEIVSILIKLKVRIEERDRWGRTPLYIAAFYRHQALVEYLINQRADVNALDKSDATPLHAVLLHQSLHEYPLKNSEPFQKIVECLLKAGACATATDVNGQTPMDRFLADPKQQNGTTVDGGRSSPEEGKQKACDSKETQAIVELFEKYKNPQEPTLEELIQKLNSLSFEKSNGSIIGDENIQNLSGYLIENKMRSLHQRDQYGWTLLHKLVFIGCLEGVKWLVQNRALVNVRIKEGYTNLKFDSTPVGPYEARRDHGLPKNGDTPLHIAAQRGFIKISEFLLQHGAGVNVGNFHGETPLHLASGGGHIRMVELLIKYGASLESRTSKRASLSNRTPLDEAENAAFLVRIQRSTKLRLLEERKRQSESFFQRLKKQTSVSSGIDGIFFKTMRVQLVELSTDELKRRETEMKKSKQEFDQFKVEIEKLPAQMKKWAEQSQRADAMHGKLETRMLHFYSSWKKEQKEKALHHCLPEELVVYIMSFINPNKKTIREQRRIREECWEWAGEQAKSNKQQKNEKSLLKSK